MQHKLAIVFPIAGDTESDNALRQALWIKATELLIPQLGKAYARFEPALSAWKQKIDRPYSVILGRSDPALFLYFFAAAKANQEAAIRFHMESFLGGMEPIDQREEDGAIICSVSFKGTGEDVAPHMLWHIGMISGELLNDCGIYYALQRQAVASNALEKEIVEHVSRYALCMVTLMTEEDGGAHEER